MPSKSAVSPRKTKTTMTTTTAAQSAAVILDLDDINRLAIALALAAADEVEENTRFANRVRANYEMLPPSKPRAARGAMPTALTATLTPIKRVEGGEINPTAPLDPYLLLEVYGAHQLRLALDLYSPAMLREGAALVAERHHGPKPAARASKAKLIDYITASLTGKSEA